MSELHVRSLAPGDVAYVAAHLRQADRDELTAVFGSCDMRQIIQNGVDISSLCWVSAAEKPLAVFGVAPVPHTPGVGTPWALATEKISRFPRDIVREGRRAVRRMLELYPHLINYVDARNTRSVRWLKRIGFEIRPPVPFGVAQLPFHPFQLLAGHRVVAHRNFR